MKITREQFAELKTLPLLKSKVITGSMAPLIEVGDKIVIDIGNKDIKRFDIVVIYFEEKLICHYLWSKNQIVSPVLLQTRNLKGHFDYPVSFDNYLGKVISHKIGFWRKLRILFGR
jgi:signal peptidase I